MSSVPASDSRSHDESGREQRQEEANLKARFGVELSNDTRPEDCWREWLD
jgi:hypothetical protein